MLIELYATLAQVEIEKRRKGKRKELKKRNAVENGMIMGDREYLNLRTGMKYIANGRMVRLLRLFSFDLMLRDLYFKI